MPKNEKRISLNLELVPGSNTVHVALRNLTEGTVNFNVNRTLEKGITGLSLDECSLFLHEIEGIRDTLLTRLQFKTETV